MWKYIADFDNAAASFARADLQVSGIDFTTAPTPGVRTTAVARLANVMIPTKVTLPGPLARGHDRLGGGEDSGQHTLVLRRVAASGADDVVAARVGSLDRTHD